MPPFLWYRASIGHETTTGSAIGAQFYKMVGSKSQALTVFVDHQCVLPTQIHQRLSKSQNIFVVKTTGWFIK